MTRWFYAIIADVLHTIGECTTRAGNHCSGIARRRR